MVLVFTCNVFSVFDKEYKLKKQQQKKNDVNANTTLPRMFDLCLDQAATIKAKIN